MKKMLKEFKEFAVRGNMLDLAFVVFLIVKGMNALYKTKEEPKAPTTKKCPYCKSEIAIEATRCPHCTSELTEDWLDK